MVLFMDPSGQTEIPVLQALSWNHFRISATLEATVRVAVIMLTDMVTDMVTDMDMVTDTKAVAIMEVTILVGYVESTAKLFLESLFTV